MSSKSFVDIFNTFGRIKHAQRVHWIIRKLVNQTMIILLLPYHWHKCRRKKSFGVWLRTIWTIPRHNHGPDMLTVAAEWRGVNFVSVKARLRLRYVSAQSWGYLEVAENVAKDKWNLDGQALDMIPVLPEILASSLWILCEHRSMDHDGRHTSLTM